MALFLFQNDYVFQSVFQEAGKLIVFLEHNLVGIIGGDKFVNGFSGPGFGDF